MNVVLRDELRKVTLSPSFSWGQVEDLLPSTASSFAGSPAREVLHQDGGEVTLLGVDPTPKGSHSARCADSSAADMGSERTPNNSRPASAGAKSNPISWFEIALGFIMLLIVGVFGSAQAQTTNCNTTGGWGPQNFTFDALGPSTQYKDLTISGSYSCGGSKTSTISLNSTNFPDLNITAESIQTSSGQLVNELNLVTARPPELVGSGNWSRVGARGITNSSNSNIIRFSLTKIGTVSYGTRYLPITYTFPWYTYQYSYSYSCGFFGSRTCYGTSFNMYEYTYGSNIRIDVPSAMALSLAGGSTTGTMDFANNLVADAKQSVNLRLRSNTPYRVSMDSAHNGVLKLNNSPGATDQIAYSATLNGNSITEGAPFIDTNTTGTGDADITIPFEVTIGDTSNARAGFYKDVVTITIGGNP